MRPSRTNASDTDTGQNDRLEAQQKPRPDLSRYMPQNLAAEFSRRVLGWLYSFSLVILMLLTLAFIVATPADVITQTWGTNAMGVKVFIIIICNALFVFMSIVYYFSRLVHSRVLINLIPSKSVYVPLEKDDLAKKPQQYIIKNLTRCTGDIKERAGPLANANEPFDYPGMSPPSYIQQRNAQLGFQHASTGLPENCVFQDVINSIGLKLKVDGLFAGHFTIPKNYTFREVILAIAEELDDDQLLDEDSGVVLRHVVADYERFKFGPHLIKQSDLMRFLANLEKIMNRYINSSGADFVRDEVLLNLSQRRPSQALTFSTGSRLGNNDEDEDDGDNTYHSNHDPGLAPYNRRSRRFLDPFDYHEDAGSLKRRSNYSAYAPESNATPDSGFLSRLPSGGREGPRGSFECSSSTDEPRQRRGSLWSIIKKRLSTSSSMHTRE